MVSETGTAPRTAWRRLAADRGARWLVTGGGLAIIASILAILVFILIEVWPLFGSARVAASDPRRVQGVAGAGVLADEHRSHLATIGHDGIVRIHSLESGDLVLRRSLLESGAPPAVTGASTVPGRQLLTAATSGGRVIAARMKWEVSFDGDTRVVTPALGAPVVFDVDPARGPIATFSARLNEDGLGTAAAELADGSLAVVRREADENLFTGEISESFERYTTTSPIAPTHLLLDNEQRNLYAGTDSGELLWWSLDDGEPGGARVVPADGPTITALTLLIGDRMLVVGRSDGSIDLYGLVRQPDETFELEKFREFPERAAAIRLLAPSLRDKGFLATDEAGGMGLYYSTSERTMWNGMSPLPGATALFYTPKGDGAFLVGDDTVAAMTIRNPHPEISFKALFGKVWYEGYPKPEYVWQSTGGTDEFEPKLSLTPLMIGTLKGTLYALILAIPLGVFGAMYASQFMSPDLKRWVKPTVELMAALPSVVLGFLAGLWLAPRVEKIVPALILTVPVVIVTNLLVTALWHRLPRTVRHRVPTGSEVLLYAAALAGALLLCLEAGPAFERLAFGGDFQDWLLRSTGLRYDQRNAIIVGIAMGFAVIPIIFSIAEDAFSNVPQNLVSGSLALGATRWQTVTRVVLPTASPGIFSGIMIGFGRAVGETMIVLMATGNTPVLDWNPFNGFRTLSANIAVEIPEAPQGGTLYRTLFLAALILFVMTFAINTLAEIVRQRLRKRYAEL